MIAYQTGAVLLDRFAQDLSRQSPLELHQRDFYFDQYNSEDLEAARMAWANRIVDEYRSVAHFSELLTHLARAEAPFSALCTIQRLIGDELRHTELCMQVANWLGGLEDLEIDLAEMRLPESDDPPAGRALEVICRELVVAEAESVRILAAYRNATTDPAIKRASTILLRDEVRHAAAGRQLQKILLEQLPKEAFGDVLETLPAKMELDRQDIRAGYRASAIDGPGRALGGSIGPLDLQSSMGPLPREAA